MNPPETPKQTLTFEELFAQHIKDDEVRFDKQDKDHVQFGKDLQSIGKFMENLSGVNNLVEGMGLLKKPAMWLMALVLGIVAFFGGVKVIVSWFLPK